MADFHYTPERHAGPPRWCFSIRANLDDERKVKAVSVARDIYRRRFGVDAPAHTETKSGEAIVLVFPLPPQQLTMFQEVNACPK